MSDRWKTKEIDSKDQAFEVFAELSAKQWLSRGQDRHFCHLLPLIDRDELGSLPRQEKLRLERRSINLFRSAAHFFASPGEESALSDDVAALIVLRHYGVPTRLLDWSGSPYVAAYFAVCGSEEEDGEIWSFDRPYYEKEGKKQWAECPETMIEVGLDAKLTMFRLEVPRNCDWFICVFYTPGFHRQNAQSAAYSMTAQFGRDHAEAISDLLDNASRHCRYVIKASLKPCLRDALRKEHGIWRGSLFPDAAGAARTADEEVFGAIQSCRRSPKREECPGE